jgi:uncharacterized membrane protein YphA (DoxX/SURF4 family)
MILNVTLWVAQVLLAIVFLLSGLLKGTQTKERMIATGQTGVRDYPLGFIRFIAACELLGAVGLVVPWATGAFPRLTPLAAAGLAIIMLGAARAHHRLREPRNVATNLVLFALLVFVVLGRARF